MPVSSPAKRSRSGSIARRREFFRDGAYRYEGEGKTLKSEEQAQYLAKLAANYPIATIEDGMAEED